MPDSSDGNTYLDVETARQLLDDYFADSTYVITADEVETLVKDTIEDATVEGSAVILESSTAVAQTAAQGAADNVSSAVSENIRSLGSTVVLIDPEQWEYIQTSIRGAAGGSLVALLLMAMILGAVVSTIIIKGWRREK